MSILLTGGAGFIGSHMAGFLLKKDIDFVIVDNLSNSDLRNINELKFFFQKDIKFIHADIRDEIKMHSIFDQFNIDSVIHFASLKSVNESIRQEKLYYENNVIGSKILIDISRTQDEEVGDGTTTVAVLAGELLREAEETGAPTPQISNYLGECILKIANHLSYRPNFINYTYREEMISDGIENCLQYIDKFDPAKSKNPFAYFTQIIYYAFIRRITKEKKQQSTKETTVSFVYLLRGHIYTQLAMESIHWRCVDIS